MSCAHCAFTCTSEGEDMSLKVFRRIVEQSKRPLTIGGGEPTLHPQFWKFLELATHYTDTPGIATNGSMTKTTIKLAKLAREGTICCALSLDKWHDSIDQRVTDAFADAPKQNGYPHITYTKDNRIVRNVTKGLVNAGRCDFGIDGCLCPSMFVKPSGTIRQCGCDDSPIIGHVQSNNHFTDNKQCYKEQHG